MKRNIDATVVRNAAHGRWIEILTALAPELDAALSKPGRHVSCPVHGGKNGFRLFKDADWLGGGVCNTCGSFHDGFALLRWLKCVDFPTIVEMVNEIVLGGSVIQPRRLARKPIQPAPPPDESIRVRLNATWGQAFPHISPKASLMWTYFQNRGINLSVKESVNNLRLHPGLKSFDEDGKYEGTYPCILALVQDRDGQPVTIHRTYITHDGLKAPVENAKKMMPLIPGRAVQGAACRLTRSLASLGVCEGIETALAVWLATGVAVWPTLNAPLLSLFDPPPGVKIVWIWGDNDLSKTGELAALELKKKLDAANVESGIWIPDASILPAASSTPRKGVDWLDVLTECGPHAFPLASVGEPREYRKAA